MSPQQTFGTYLSWLEEWSYKPSVESSILSVPIYAMCLGGEEAVLKTVGRKRLAGSNPVHGVYFVNVLKW